MTGSNLTIDFSQRDPLNGVNELIAQRWSPRAFKSTPIADDTLAQIFDAARWAPSCYNEQPWLFITNNDDNHQQFLDLLVEGNQAWAKDAPILGFIIANKTFAKNGNPNKHADFDSGSAWMAMTLQARSLGLYTHGMAGINYDDVYEAFDLDPEQHDVICGFALGEIDSPEKLPEGYRNAEKPTPRKALSEIWRR